MSYSHSYNHRRAFTLTEMSVVLGIIGLILASIWVAADRVRETQRVERSVAQVQSIINNFKTVYGGKNAVNVAASDVSAFAAHSGFAPSDMVRSSSPDLLFNLWGGAVGVYVNPGTNVVSITYYSLSQRTCNALGMALTHIPDVLWESISPNGTQVGNTDRQLPPLGTDAELTASDIANTCTNTRNNYVAFGYSMK